MKLSCIKSLSLSSFEDTYETDIKEWWRANPRVTYVQIEDEVHKRLMQLEARLIEGAVDWSLSPTGTPRATSAGVVTGKGCAKGGYHPIARAESAPFGPSILGFQKDRFQLLFCHLRATGK